MSEIMQELRERLASMPNPDIQAIIAAYDEQKRLAEELKSQLGVALAGYPTLPEWMTRTMAAEKLAEGRLKAERFVRMLAEKDAHPDPSDYEEMVSHPEHWTSEYAHAMNQLGAVMKLEERAQTAEKLVAELEREIVYQQDERSSTVAALAAEQAAHEQTWRSRDSWEQDARRYATNSDLHQAREAKLRAALTAIENPDQSLIQEAVATGDPVRIIQRLTEVMEVMRGMATCVLRAALSETGPAPAPTPSGEEE